MKNKKVLYGVIVALIIIVVGVLVVLLGGKKYKKTVFLGGGTRLTLSDVGIIVDTDDVKIRKQSVKVYKDNTVIDGYVKTNEESSTGIKNYLSMYDKNNNYIQSDGFIAAYTKDLTIDFINSEKNSDIDSIDKIDPYIKKDYINTKTDTLDYYVVDIFDLDNDGKNEFVYSFGFIRNVFMYEAFVLMYKDGQYYIIEQSIDEYNEDSQTYFELASIMDIDGNGKYEFIVSKSEGESNDISYGIYNFTGSRFIDANIATHEES